MILQKVTFWLEIEVKVSFKMIEKQKKEKSLIITIYPLIRDQVYLKHKNKLLCKLLIIKSN